MARFSGRGTAGAAGDDGFGDGMCGGEEAPLAQGILRERPKCSKCSDTLASLRVRKECVCKSCLITDVRNRARRSITGTPAVASSLMVAVSGGAASRLLLDAVHRLMDCGRRHRQFTSASAVHVDVSGVASLFSMPGAADVCRAAALAAVKQCVREGINAVLVPIEQVFTESPCWIAVPAPTMTAPPPTSPAPSRDFESVALADDDPRVLAALAEATTQLDALRAHAWFAAATAAAVAAFSALASVDARQDLLEAVIMRVCVRTAAAAGVCHLAFGDTADRMANRLLNMTCSGGGYTMPLATSPVDNRYAAPAAVAALATAVGAVAGVAAAGGAAAPVAASSTGARAAGIGAGGVAAAPLTLPDNWYAARIVDAGTRVAPPAPGGVVIVRPLLEHESKEAAAYCRFLELDTTCTPTFLTMAVARASVAAATSSLIATLQAEFVNTVHNVVRTTRKLKLPDNAPADSTGLVAAAPVARVPKAGSLLADALAASALSDDDKDDVDAGAVPPAAAAARVPPSLCSTCGQLLPPKGSSFAVLMSEAAARIGVTPAASTVAVGIGGAGAAAGAATAAAVASVDASAAVAATVPVADSGLCYSCSRDKRDAARKLA